MTMTDILAGFHHNHLQGTTFYYVQRTGGLHMMWESEDLIHESDPAFKVFCEKIEAAGYSIRGSSTSASSHRNGCRPPRLSKTRALLRFQPMGDDGNESGSDSDQSMVLVKDAHSRKRTRSSGSKATAKKPRRGLARKAEVAEARDKRKNERAGFDDAESVEISNADCCLRCKVQLYRQAVNTGDVEQLTVLINDKDHIPGWYRAECQQDCDHVMKEAISGGNQQIVELLLKDGLKAHEQERVEIPRKYNSYGDDTGYVSRYSYGRALRKVNESRGNRQGNRAFFRNAETNLLDVDMLRLGISTLDHSILAAMQEECVTDDMADVVCSTRNAVCGNYFWEGIGIYFCVASGNWQTAGNLIIASRQESNFNHLHIQVLKRIRAARCISQKSNPQTGKRELQDHALSVCSYSSLAKIPCRFLRSTSTSGPGRDG
ncbi:hypothetical protein BX666DRAFT_396971 [Dichotomocladium elegans]|nr:hypothetical protein BX666DRAFT_396971 [Dichotomocladium elegans]